MKNNKNKLSKEIKKIIKETEEKMCINEVNKELYLESSELLFEMEKSHFKGTYKIVWSDIIEWRIQDNVTIVIDIDDEVIYFYYKDPYGNEHRDNGSDYIPYNHRMEVLSEYNNCKFEIKEKGLFRKKYKLVIFR